ncbi:MAG: hypothetical protein ACOZQL_06665, partial [Myxococcota bacterium]
GCATCRRERALADARAEGPSSAEPSGLVDRVMLATGPRSASRVVGPLAVAAAVTLVAGGGWLLATRDAGLTPRGGADVRDWRQRVAAELRPVDAVQRAVEAQASLPVSTRWALWYRNAETQRPLYLLAYVVDARGDVHWLTPAYEVAAHEPPPTTLRSAQAEQLLEEVVQFDASPGPATLVTAISLAPASVLELDAAPPDVLRHLEQRLPDAVVWRREVTLIAPPGGTK